MTFSRQSVSIVFLAISVFLYANSRCVISVDTIFVHTVTVVGGLLLRFEKNDILYKCHAII